MPVQQHAENKGQAEEEVRQSLPTVPVRESITKSPREWLVSKNG